MKNLVTGEAGRQLGERAFQITTNNNGGKFKGQWGQVGYNIVGQIAGTHSMAEGMVGIDLATNEAVTGTDRAVRIASGAAQFASAAAGGAGMVRNAAGSASFTNLPGSAAVSNAYAKLGTMTSRTLGRIDDAAVAGNNSAALSSNREVLSFVRENLGVARTAAQQAARDFESGTAGAMSDVATRQRLVPAIRYTNPNPNGSTFVKFDGLRQLDDGIIEVIDAKTRIVPFETRQGPFISPSVRDGLVRKSLAAEQNPGYKAVLEFPNAAARTEAQRVLRQLGITNISTRVR